MKYLINTQQLFSIELQWGTYFEELFRLQPAWLTTTNGCNLNCKTNIQTCSVAVILATSIFAVYENKNSPSEISLLHYALNRRHCAENTVTTRLSYFVGKLYVHTMYFSTIPVYYSSVYICITTLVSARLRLIRMEFSDPCCLKLNLRL